MWLYKAPEVKEDRNKHAIVIQIFGREQEHQSFGHLHVEGLVVPLGE